MQVGWEEAGSSAAGLGLSSISKGFCSPGGEGAGRGERELYFP